MRVDMRRIDAQRLHQILFHVVRATLAQIDILFTSADRIGVTLNCKRRLRVPFQKIDKLLQDAAGLKIGAVETEKLIFGHSNLRPRTERTFLREQLVEIAKSRGAFFVRTRAIAGKLARERVRAFDDGARGQFCPAQRGLRPARNRAVIQKRLLMCCVRILRKRLRRASLDLVHH